MSLLRLKQSVNNAWRGLAYTFKQEQNFRLQILFGFFVLLFCWIFKIDRRELIIVLFLVFLVLGLELSNTVLEKFLDVIKPRLHYEVKIIKDLAAALVFLTVFGAGIIGLVIFLPYFIDLWYSLVL